MTAWETALAWAAARATLLALLGVVLYVRARRRGAHAAAGTALAALLAMGGSAVLMVSPWPRWATWQWAPSNNAPQGHSANADVTSSVPSLPPTWQSRETAMAHKDPADWFLPRRLRRATGGLETRRPLTLQAVPAIKAIGQAGRIGIVRLPAARRWQFVSGLVRTLPTLVFQAPRQSHMSTSSIPSIKSIPNAPCTTAPTTILAWAAGAFIGAALLRWLAGLWAVHRLVRRARPMENALVLGVAAQAATALGLRRPITLRISHDLETAAAVGWLNPTILLPADWPAWSDSECRAVLAHELAHLARRDYPARLAAQLCVALHAYQPLAHWLANRLRHAQELAADTLAAPLAGGRQPYLQALARLALRHDSRLSMRPAARAARPLFPEFGSLLRRIEMLSKVNDGPTPARKPASRIVTYGVLIGLGMMLAGLRPESEGAGRNSAVNAQEAPKSEAAAKSKGPAPLSFDHVPSDAALVVAARPSALLKHKDLRAVLDAFKGKDAEAARILGLLDLADLEQVTVVLNPSAASLVAAGGGEEALVMSGALIVRSAAPRDWKAAASALVPGALVEARHAGRTYQMVQVDDKVSIGFFQPDERTVVVAAANVLPEFMRAHKKGEPQWAAAWKASAGSDVLIAADTGALVGPLLPLISARTSELDEVLLIAGPVAPLWEQTETLVIGVDLAGKLGLRLDATCGDEAGARRVEHTLQAVLTLGENAAEKLFPLLRREALGSDGKGAALLTLIDLGEQLLAGAKVERADTRVTLRLTSETELSVLVRLAMQAL